MQNPLLAVLALLALGAGCSVNDSERVVPQPDATTAQGAADAGPQAADAAASGPLAFMSECNPADDQCDADNDQFCFSFNSKGPRCTHSCSAPEECEAPSTGCNNMGVCKAP